MEYDLKLLHIETKAKIEITGTINIGWVNCNVIYLPYGLTIVSHNKWCINFVYNKLPVQAP